MKVLRKKGLLCLLTIMLFQNVIFANGFTDLHESSEGYEAVLKMQELQVIKGYPDGTFLPEKSVSRAEFVSMINRMFGFSSPSVNSFKDVHSEHWAYEDILIAIDKGYIKGTPEGYFLPEQTITRNEVAVMLNRILKFENDERKDINQKIKDIEKVPEWAQEAVVRMVSFGVMSVDEQGLFNGAVTFNRINTAEVLFIVHNQTESEDQLSGEIETGEPVVSTGPVGGIPNYPSVSPQPLQDQELIESIDAVTNALEARVLPRVTTDRQREVTELIIQAMRSYKADIQYDIESSMNRVRRLKNQMTEDEMNAYEDLIVGFVPSYHYRRLNDHFKLQ